MTFSLYAATVPSCQQILSAVMRMLDKAEAFCVDQEIAPNTIVEARLAENMLPFAYQVKSTVVHSLGAIIGVRNGVFSPDTSPPPADFATLKGRITETLATLAAIDPAEIDGFVGRDMRFAFADHRIDFTAENFLLSFSQPNFYFHAVTAYDILRWKGVPLGKRDFLGGMRVRQ